MPLEVLAIIVPLGIALVVLVVNFSGLSNVARLDNASDAVRQFSLDFAGVNDIEDIFLTEQNNAAFLLFSDGGRLGLVEAFGDKYLTRLLGATDILAYKEIEDGKLSLQFRDFSHPRGTYKFDKRDIAQNIIGAIKNMEMRFLEDKHE